MLQRIQTLYLLAVTALITTTAFLPLAGVEAGQAYRELNVFGLVDAENNLQPMWGPFVLTVIIALLALATIFLYNKRILQIRLCIFNCLMILGFYALTGLQIYLITQAEGGATISVKLALAFPLVSLVLNYLAMRNIGADETLVRSLHRLR
ncbi:MAG: DUF4293 domain-containing protein [Tannerellaceae bacterium]|jgi:hypothetical protein|nr:DUF4293 domain-containing protein [Tannerellaceae bacterium]